MSEQFKILTQFVKDMSSETPDVETYLYVKEYLKNLVSEHFKETESQLSKKIIENFDDEVNNFVQVCPKEMLDKLKNPITLKNFFESKPKYLF